MTSGACPSLLAAQGCHEGCLALLLEAKADPEQADPLQAAKNGHAGCLTLPL